MKGLGLAFVVGWATCSQGFEKGDFFFHPSLFSRALQYFQNVFENFGLFNPK